MQMIEKTNSIYAKGRGKKEENRENLKGYLQDRVLSQFCEMNQSYVVQILFLEINCKAK